MLGYFERTMSMLFHNLKFSGLLSFGPQGIDLPMKPLTLLIGPNGSGKSNLLEAISLFRAAPRAISEPIWRMGGVQEWVWKGQEASRSINLEAMVAYPPGGTLRHSLTLVEQQSLPLVIERIEPSEKHRDERIGMNYYRPPLDAQNAADVAAASARALSESKNVHSDKSSPVLLAKTRKDKLEVGSDFEPHDSMLANIASPDRPALWHLNKQYSNIRLYRNWSFGPDAKLRQPCSAHERSDFLTEGGENLPLVLSQLHSKNKKTFLTALNELFEGIVDIQCPVTSGTVTFFLEESGDRLIPATRLSDGTLRYLCLLAILLHPEPPSLICIEEPELGLHPDLLPTLSDLMREASERTQLVVTTHSDVLVDTLTDQPESVVVCEKHDGQTEMKRLDKGDLERWLKDYRLGNLWTSGELGGNRW